MDASHSLVILPEVKSFVKCESRLLNDIAMGITLGYYKIRSRSRVETGKMGLERLASPLFHPRTTVAGG